MPKAKQLGLYLVGYVIAVASSSIIAAIAYYVLTRIALRFPDGIALKIAFPPSQMFEVIQAGFLYTAIFGFPGFVVAMVLARYFDWRNMFRFVVAGAMNGAFANLLVFVLVNEYLGLLIVCSMLGGAVGGTLYWLASGRNLTAERLNQNGA